MFITKHNWLNFPDKQGLTFGPPFVRINFADGKVYLTKEWMIPTAETIKIWWV